MSTCAICLEPVSEDVEPLSGCTHRFHPACIIPYFRTAAASGRCPECRRNPFQEDGDQNYDDDDDDDVDEDPPIDWSAMGRIRELQKNTAVRSRDPKIKKRVQKINSRIKAAREVRKEALDIQRKFKASREYANMRADVSRHKESEKEHRRERKKLAKEIHKKTRLGEKFSLKQARNRVNHSKSVLGSQVDPLWQYYETGRDVWSEQLSSNDIRRLYTQGIITNETRIWHPHLAGSVPYERLHHDFRYRYV